MQARAMDSDSPLRRLRQGTFHAVVELRGNTCKASFPTESRPRLFMLIVEQVAVSMHFYLIASAQVLALKRPAHSEAPPAPSPCCYRLFPVILLCQKSQVRPTAHPSCRLHLPQLMVTLVGSELSFMQRLGRASRDKICDLGKDDVGKMIHVGTACAYTAPRSLSASKQLQTRVLAAQSWVPREQTTVEVQQCRSRGPDPKHLEAKGFLK